MRPDTQLDYAIFQLTPNRDRCELYVVAQGQTYKLASGLLNPFLAHLRTAEEQIAQGAQSIRLEPPDPRSAGWFTKGTVERFVRFVSTPEVLERVSTIEMELIEVAEAIRTQASNALEETQTAEDHPSMKVSPSSVPSGGSPQDSSNLEQIAAKAHESIEDSKPGLEENTKRWLLRALDARQMMLKKEQEMAFGRAIAAGFTFRHVGDLVLFAERFGANRLREACIQFMAFCQKRKESEIWLDDADPATAANCQSQLPLGGVASGNAIKCLRPKEYPEAWSDIQSRDAKNMELRRASFPIEGTLPTVVNGVENLMRDGSIDGERWQAMARMGYAPSLMWPINRQVSAYGMNQLPPENMHASGFGNQEYRKDLGSGGIPDMERGSLWQGQSQYFQGNPLHRAMPPPTVSPSVRFPMHAQLGLAHPQSFDNLYMHPTYSENKWQLHPATVPPLQYYPGNQGDNRTQPIGSEKEMNADPQNGENTALSTENIPDQRDVRDGSTLMSQSSDEITDRKEATNLPIPCVSSEELDSIKPVDVLGGKEETSKDSQTPLHLNDVPMQEEMSKDSRTPSHLTDVQGSSQDMGEESSAETIRRFPRRGSSPSRRSVSPMRKVQIARSGFRRSGSFAKRSNYSVLDGHSVVDDAVESSEEETGGDEVVHKISETSQDKAEPVRVRVQDVIGLFESKKEDNSDIRKQVVRKESRRLPSKNPVLSRWSENGSRTERQVSLPLENDASTESEISKRKFRQATDVEKDTSNEEVSNSVAVNHNDDRVDEQGKIQKEVSASEAIQSGRISADKCDSSSPNATQDFTTAGSQFLEQPMDDSFITFEPKLNVDTHNEQKLDEESDQSEDAEVVEDDDRQNRDETDLKDDKSKTFGYGLHDTDGREKNGMKTSEKELKAKAMQEMLEKRKAAAVKSSKPTPLVAIAQSRAEKLRAYKAGLQQSKKEKEEKERKRIEDLKTQRRERMAARNSAVVSAPETTAKKVVQTPPSSGSRSSATAFHKISSTSPQNSIGGAATLSPTSIAKKKISGGKKPSRPTAQASENILSQSVPSFTDLKKENLKTASTVRASTGSQRFSQLKKSIKDPDAASPLKANNAEEKKHTLSSATVRKGIPPARDTKSDGLPSHKVPKISSSATKPQRKTGGTVKYSEKSAAAENGKAADEVKAMDVSSAAVAVPVAEEETKKDVNEEIHVELTEADITVVEVDVPAEGVESTCTKVADLPHEVEFTSIRQAIDLEISSIARGITEGSKEASYVPESSSERNILTCCDVNDGEFLAVIEAQDVPVARLPSTSGTSVTDKVESVYVDESPADQPPILVPEQYDPNAIADTPSKSLPRLHEAIQQAHSPEISLSKLKKKQGDNGSQKSHQAKGLKRLLFLGRKSSRNTSSAQNLEGHEDIDVNVNTTKHSKNGSEGANSSSGRSNLKSQGDEVASGSSTSKGSRSFFSLALRGKGEGR